MEDILILDQNITYMKQAIESVLSFSSSYQLQDQLKFIQTDMQMQDQFMNLFIDKFQQYIELHLLPVLQKQLQFCKKDKNQQIKTFITINKGIYKMKNHIENFFTNVDISNDQNLYNRVKKKIKNIIIFQIYEKLQIEQLTQTFFEALFYIYKENLQQNIKKDQHQPSSVQNQFILYQIEQIIHFQTFQFENEEMTHNIKLVLNYLIDLYKDYHNYFLHNQYQFINNLSYNYIKNVFQDLKNIVQQEKKFQQEYEGFYQLLVKDYLKWIFVQLDLSVSTNDLLYKEFLYVVKNSMNRILQQELSPHLFDIMLYCSDEKQFLEFVAFNLQNSDISESMTQKLQDCVQKELLKISVSTKTIIKFYLTLLRFWSEMKNSFTALQEIAESIKKYFLKRENALRCIIQLWIEEIKEQRDYNMNNKKEESQVFNVPIADERDLASNEDLMSSEQQIEFMVQKSKKTNNNKVKFKKSNVKSLLIDLYGSRDSFLEEYEIFMAEKILYFKTINLQEEKESFGFLKQNLKNSQNLSRFNVLLHDINDSEKIIDSFTNQHPEFSEHNFLVLSKSFWPINYQLQDINPDVVKKYLPAIEKFKKHYQKYSNDQKKIILHNCIGNVELELELNKQKIDVVCSTLHAILLMVVQDNKNIQLDQLQEMLGIDEAILRQKMQFWISKQIILETRGNGIGLNAPTETERKSNLQSEQFAIEDINCDNIHYNINLKYNANEGFVVNKNDKNEWILQSKELGKHSQNELQKQKIENLIVQILRDSGAKTIDKIYDLLKTIYKGDIPALFDMNFLRKSLEKMIKTRKINQQGDIYYHQND